MANEDVLAQEAQEATPPVTEPTPPAQEAEPTPPATEPTPPTEPVPPANEPPKEANEPPKDPPKLPGIAEETERLQSQMKKAYEMARNATARASAAELGIKPDRLDYAAQLAKLDDIDMSAPDASEKIVAALQAVADALPEFKGGVGTGSLGNHARTAQTAEDKARADFQRGMNM